MALLHPRPLKVAPSPGASPTARLRVTAERALHHLRPGDGVELWLEGAHAHAASIVALGPSPASFAVERFAGDARARATVVALAPGIARLAVMVHGAVVQHLTLVCRAPALDGFARCERAYDQHRARLAALGGFTAAVLDELDHARRRLESAQRARMMDERGLSEARTLAVLLTDAMEPAARAPLELLRAVWSRASVYGVATRAIAILAAGELIPACEPPPPPPVTTRDLLEGIRAASAREERWVSTLLEAWPLRLQGMTMRAPDLELDAGIAACTVDTVPVRAAYWRAWFHEHALVIRLTPGGARAAWRTSRGLLEEVGAELPAAWRASVAAEVDAIAAAASALGVL